MINVCPLPVRVVTGLNQFDPDTCVLMSMMERAMDGSEAVMEVFQFGTALKTAESVALMVPRFAVVFFEKQKNKGLSVTKVESSSEESTRYVRVKKSSLVWGAFDVTVSVIPTATVESNPPRMVAINVN